MSRSLWIREDFEEKVRRALRRKGYPNHKSFAEDAGYAPATISSFFSRAPVDRVIFEELCEKLDLDWKDVAAGSEIYISYAATEIDTAIAQSLAHVLRTQGYEVFPPRRQPIKPRQRSISLKRCDYCVIIVSEASAVSEVVLEEVRVAVEFRDSRRDQRPCILTVLTQPDTGEGLFYNLSSLLDGTITFHWRSPADTDAVAQAVLAFLAEGTLPDAPQPDPPVPSTEAPLPPLPPDPNLDARPVPVAAPEIPEGQVSLASRFYIERKGNPTSTLTIEEECYQAIAQPGALIRIKAPRQMGKTSLMARILNRAEQQGSRAIAINLQLTSRKWFADIDQFLEWFCAAISRELKIPNRVNEYLSDRAFDSNTNCKAYFEDYLFQQVEEPMTIALDEVDRLFEYPDIYKDFFGLLRALHEESKRRELWERFRLVVVYSTEVYVPLNVYQSPFNVGLAINLPEFTPEQVLDLARRYQLQIQAADLEHLMHLIGGHPFLVRLALYSLARKTITLPELLKTAASPTGIFGDHLRHCESILMEYPELAVDMKTVIEADAPVNLKKVSMWKLQGIGLLRTEEYQASPRCELYRQYFQNYPIEI